MKITIDEDVCRKNNISIGEIFYLILVKEEYHLDVLKKALINKGALTEENKETYITSKYSDILSNVIIESDKSLPSEDELTLLAKEMMNIYPSGKSGLYYWRGNLKDIKNRLQKFFKIYGSSYTKEQILESTRKYVSSFNGVYKGMRLLKYFIWKDERRIREDGTSFVEEFSDLATYLENAGEENSVFSDWTVEAR